MFGKDAPVSWSYDDPSSSPTDAVRFLIGDVVEEQPTLSDEEIEFALAENGNAKYQAAYDCCMALAARFSRMATSKSVGDLSLSYAGRADQFRVQAERMQVLAGRREMGAPWAAAGALKRSDQRTSADDSGTEFRVGQHDNPGGSGDLV